MGPSGRENKHPAYTPFRCPTYRAGGNHKPATGIPIMNQLQAWYTKERKIYVTWFSEVKGRFVRATFADLNEIRDMLPVSVAQQIEACLTVNDLLSP